MCCCKRVAKMAQLSLFPLLYTMLQTADDPTAFSGLVRIELGDAYLGPSAATLLAEVPAAYVVSYRFTAVGVLTIG